MNCSAPTATVIVPCRNEVSHIEACLTSVLSQEPPSGGFEVLVADGMSTDGTREILDEWARLNRIRIVENSGEIASTGLNQAIRLARGRVIIRMDAHSEYAPDYIRQCVAVLEEAGADNVGGAARTKSSGYIQVAIAAAYQSAFSAGGARFHNPDYEGYVDTVTYGCWRREAFDRFGFFDEELVRNQDDEHNFRIALSGGKVWQSRKIKSWYAPRPRLTELFAQYAQYGYWKVRILQKHGKPAALRHIVPGLFVLMTFLLPLTAASIWPAALLVWQVMLATYGAVNLAGSVLVAAKNNWLLLPVLPVVFICYHFGYGWGFLRGMWDFVILGKTSARHYEKITRHSVRAARH